MEEEHVSGGPLERGGGLKRKEGRYDGDDRGGGGGGVEKPPPPLLLFEAAAGGGGGGGVGQGEGAPPSPSLALLRPPSEASEEVIVILGELVVSPWLLFFSLPLPLPLPLPSLSLLLLLPPPPPPPPPWKLPHRGGDDHSRLPRIPSAPLTTPLPSQKSTHGQVGGGSGLQRGGRERQERHSAGLRMLLPLLPRLRPPPPRLQPPPRARVCRERPRRGLQGARRRPRRA